MEYLNYVNRKLVSAKDFGHSEIMKEVFTECGENCYIELPFHANWGGHHVHFGFGIYANSNLTLVDDGHIYIGDKVMFGPNVTIATASHPINPELRDRGLQWEIHDKKRLGRRK